MPLSIIFVKLYVFKYPLAGLIPVRSYTVDLSIEVDGHGKDISISTYLPMSDSRQRIDNEANSSGKFAFSINTGDDNRVLRWHAQEVFGKTSIVYSFDVQAHNVRYNIPASLEIPASYTDDLKPYLKGTDGIQVNDPLIEAELAKLFPGKKPRMLEALSRIHGHLQRNFKNMNFSGYTDALTALKLGEASCNGKSRLFAALARKLNIPTRLVGGLVMKQGSKKVTHQWVEAYVNGHWVPFDAINDYFAEIPAHYLTLYYDDNVLFKRTANVNFQYFYKMTKRIVPQRAALESIGASKLNVITLYSVFEKVGISQNLLKIILMIPLGALVTVIFRNIVGLETFGTFLPALIAAAARETGLLWGVVGFTIIILLSSTVRRALDWLRLLHTPKMSIMLVTVVIFMMSMTVLGVHAGLFDLAHVTLFPIAILAITAERFALIEVEQGFGKSLKILGVTLIVVAACYLVMDSLFLQSMMLAFPELLLMVVAINLWLGKWMGIRVMEFLRFKRLIFGGNGNARG
jgi:hypothetical protein